MAHLWQINPSGSWAVTPLDSTRVALSGSAAALFPSVRGSAGAAWVVVAASSTGVAVNGRPLTLGIHVLRDRDELRLGDGSHHYFSTERLAGIHAFAGARPVCCPRCRESIAPDTLVVTCPGCGAVSHQSDSRGCWVYGPTCPLCDQPTALDAGYRWTPEEL